METTKVDMVPEMVVIDREGDVILVLKDVELRVSSKVLSLASPVFKTMFGPSFVEGKSITSSSPSRITLTDDNPIAMVNLCNIIHYQTKSMPKQPDQPFLDQLAIVADKYDCIEALRSSTHMWLTTLEAEAASVIEEEPSTSIGKLLYPAYTFDCAIAFEKITRSMVYYVGGTTSQESPTQYQICPAIQALLPEGLLGKLAVLSTLSPTY